MALLGNPFIANFTRTLTPEELAQALRVDIAGELEAIIGYEAHAAATNDARAKKVLYHIADEERQHVGELQQLLAILSPKDGEWVDKGKSAVLQQQATNFQAPLS
jgi:rubrerythrin